MTGSALFFAFAVANQTIGFPEVSPRPERSPSRWFDHKVEASVLSALPMVATSRPHAHGDRNTQAARLLGPSGWKGTATLVGCRDD